jgi:hypothetical protein
MARLFRTAILMACFLSAGSAFAGTYYIAANGSDSNNGTSKTTPWLHAPGMANCTASCAAHIPVAGDQFIFRGGDTWHFGNGSASPYVGVTSNCGLGGPCGWHIAWSGSSGNPIYFGVDQTWFSGASWTRPILNGDNPTSKTGVSSCTYDQSTEVFLQAASISNITVDNFEFTGLCWHGNQAGANENICCSKYMQLQTNIGAGSNRVIENVAMHGWTHVTYSCSLSGGEPTGNCDGTTGIGGPSDPTLGIGDQYIGVACDGSDSDNQSFTCVFGGGYDIHNSVFRYASNGVIINNAHLFHDNLIEFLASSGDRVSHGNGFEFNTEFNGNNAVYNNVLRHLWLIGICEVTAWQTPQTTDYTFNNLVYDEPCTGNIWNLVGPSGGGAGGWTANFFNNTFAVPAGGFAGAPSGSTVNFYNNHCIIPGTTAGNNGSQCSAYQGTENYLTNLLQTPAAATAQGYTASETFAYSPSSGSAGTVREGTNEQSICTAMSSAGLSAAATACQSGTGYACAYNTSTHTLTCPAMTPVARPTSGTWDVGAYEYGGTQASAPNPPTGLTVSVQ